MTTHIVDVTDQVLITRTEDSVLWECRFTINDYQYFLLFNEGDEFIINFLGEEYHFLFSSKSFIRSSPGYFQGVIHGQSPALRLTAPRVELKNFTFETDELASIIFETILETTLEWTTVDWPIKAFRVAAENAVPLDFVKSSLESVGLILESKKTGELKVRAKHPVAIVDYFNVIPDQVYTDMEDNLSASTNYEPHEGYNKFRVTNEDVGFNDQLEAVETGEGTLEYFIRAYPAPWRTNLEVVQTDGVTVALSNLGWLTREEEEQVEIVEGAATLQYPAEELLELTWLSEVLPITHTQYSNQLTTPLEPNFGYGLVNIRYRVKYLEYLTSAPNIEAVQYLLVDLG